MENVSISTKLNADEYVRVNFYMLYRKILAIFLFGIGAIMLLIILYYYLIDPSHFESFPFYQFIFGIYATVGMPLGTYWAARRSFRNNPRLQETILYTIDHEFIELKGESFNSKLTWEKIYKVTETKRWMLIWQTKSLANVLPKKDFDTKSLTQFKSLIRGISGLKTNMKK
jgi:hypothetical protein